MTRLQRNIFLEGMKLVDLLIMCSAFFLAMLAVHRQIEGVPVWNFFSMRIKIENFMIFLGFIYAWSMILSFSTFYHTTRFTNPGEEILESLKVTGLLTLVFLAATFVFNLQMVTPVFLLVFFFWNSIFLIMSRMLIHFTLALARKRGRNLRMMLVVGTNPRAIRFARQLVQKPDLGYRLVGFVDDDWPGLAEFPQHEFSLKGGLAAFPGLLREHVVDEVIIALPMQSKYVHASRIVDLCEEQGVVVRFISDIFNSRFVNGKSDQFEDSAIVTIYPGAMLGWPGLAKRALDLVLSLALLIVFAPLFLIIALLIKFASPGPVFFVQDRVGLNKRIFPLYKFRTMIQDAEKKMKELEHLNEVQGAAFKITNDPRITPLGKVLRKLSLDELPQLYNILRGDMSLVGPRPLPIRDYNGFSKDWQRRRFSVPPGLTCLWQISGRSSISFDKWMELDMQYIDQWSLWLDLKILLKTIPAVLRGEGAV